MGEHIHPLIVEGLVLNNVLLRGFRDCPQTINQIAVRWPN